MSVINKMLRDLDLRRSAPVTSGASPAAKPGAMHGVASVKDAGAAASGLSARLWRVLPLTMFLLLGVAGAAWWYLNGSLAKPVQPRPLAVPAAVSGPVAAAPVTAPVPAAPVVEPAARQMAEPAAQASTAQTDIRKTQPREAPVVPSASRAKPTETADAGTARPKVTSSAGSKSTLETEAEVKQPHKEARKEAQREEIVSAGLPRAGAAEKPSTSADAASPASAFKPRAPAKPEAAKPTVAAPTAAMVSPAQAASLEALAQAQTLWTAGSHESAIELMRKAVAVAERTISPAADPGALSVFASLVRELSRMELSQGQVAEVMDRLIRLEPVLLNQADLWAVRGNAAQRLGKHQDSANAYLMALKLRPGEPRWMLGAAVSLAVQGQTGAAAELADKARAAGVVSPEISAYLRQLGVPLRDR